MAPFCYRCGYDFQKALGIGESPVNIAEIRHCPSCGIEQQRDILKSAAIYAANPTTTETQESSTSRPGPSVMSEDYHHGCLQDGAALHEGRNVQCGKNLHTLEERKENSNTMSLATQTYPDTGALPYLLAKKPSSTAGLNNAGSSNSAISKVDLNSKLLSSITRTDRNPFEAPGVNFGFKPPLKRSTSDRLVSTMPTYNVPNSKENLHIPLSMVPGFSPQRANKLLRGRSTTENHNFNHNHNAVFGPASTRLDNSSSHTNDILHASPPRHALEPSMPRTPTCLIRWMTDSVFSSPEHFGRRLQGLTEDSPRSPDDDPETPTKTA